MTTVTLAAGIAWVLSALGKFWNPDNAHGYQCKDFVDAYCLYIWNNWVDTVRPGNGADVFNNANPEYLVKVRNDPGRPDQLPPPGSIVSIAGSAAVPEGHTAIVLAADADGMWVGQMNGYTQTAAHKARLTYDGLIGWLIPKFAPDQNTTEVEDMKPEDLRAIVRSEVWNALAYATKDGVEGGNERGGLYEMSQDVKDIKRTLTPGVLGQRTAGEAIAAVDQIVKEKAE